jgi:hypothetical protein
MYQRLAQESEIKKVKIDTRTRQEKDRDELQYYRKQNTIGQRTNNGTQKYSGSPDFR